MQVWKIDVNNIFTGESYFVEKAKESEITTPITIGYVKPLWNGMGWVEGATQSEIDSANAITPEQEIISLKVQLAETDYKIIKCSEYQLIGQELPYDIQLLHNERQPLRGRINELELLS